MVSIPIGSIVEATGAEAVGVADARVTSFEIDSRRCRPGALFFAFSGTRVDGHDFVADAVARGAVAGVVVRPVPGVPTLLVRDVGQALLEAGRVARDHFGGTVVAITGSVGKTTTKEMVAALLSTVGPTHKTEGNLNNLLGVPLTLSRVPDDARYAVIEMGMNAPGEIDSLAGITRPHVGIITNVGPVHLEGLGSVEGVRRAKAEMIPHVTEAMVLPGDDGALVKMARQAGVRVVTFGWRDADVTVKEVEVDGTAVHGRIDVAGTEVEVTLGAPMPAYLLNAAAAFAAIEAAGVRGADPSALARMSLPSGRMEIRDAAGVRIVFDAYNANPVSFRAAMDAVSRMKARRTIGLFGDMLELGDASDRLHEELGRQARGFDFIVYVGERYDSFRAGLGDAVPSVHATDPEDAATIVLGEIAPGDILLIKASHGIRLHDSLAIILKRLEG